jgi:hypothetical protein
MCVQTRSTSRAQLIRGAIEQAISAIKYENVSHACIPDVVSLVYLAIVDLGRLHSLLILYTEPG